MANANRGLQTLLYVLSVIEAVAGLALIFGTGWVLSFAPTLVPFASTPYVVATLKGLGILALAFGYLMCVTAREPARYLAVIDTMIFVTAAAGVLGFYSVGVLHLGHVYPSPYLLTRAAIQLAIAVLLLVLRPRNAART